MRDACARGAPLDAGTSTTPASWEVALHAAGAAVGAARSAARGEPCPVDEAPPEGVRPWRDLVPYVFAAHPALRP